MEEGEVDATLLSAAGLKRLEIDAGTAIPTEIILPAPGQAVIGMECRTNDTRTQSVLSTVNNQITYDCVMAERAFTRALGATCASPVAAFCVLEDGDLRMRGQLFSEDGSEMVEKRLVFDCGEFKAPAELARSLLDSGARIDPEAVRAGMRCVLVLRPEPGASATVDRARERGLDAVAVPLFEVEPLAWEAPDSAGFDGLLLTSANAVRFAGGELQELRGLPVYAVGEATGEAAREAGFNVSAVGEDGVERLLGSIKPDLRLLHLCGEHRREPADARQKVTAIPVYAARAVEDPDSWRGRGLCDADPLAALGPPLRRAGGQPQFHCDRRDQPCGCGRSRKRLGKGRNDVGTDRQCAAGPCGTPVQHTSPEMNGTRTGMGWGARLLVALVLIIAGAGAATWVLPNISRRRGSWASCRTSSPLC